MVRSHFRALSLRAIIAILALAAFIFVPLTACSYADKEKEEAVFCMVTFDSAGGSAVRAQNVKAGGLIVEPKDPVRAGYDFIGWCKDPDGDEPWRFATDKVEKDTTLYAKWVGASPDDPSSDGNTFTVRFDTAGGSAVRAQSVKAGGLVVEPKDPTKEYYIFAGWYTSAEYTKSWNFGSDTVTASTTLYAKWEVKPADPEVKPEYRVTFVTDGGSMVPTQTVVEGGYVIEPKDPIKANSIFAGWYSDTNYTKPWDFSLNAVEKGMTLYAKWEAKPVDPGAPTEYTVTFETNGGSAVNIQIVKEGEKAVKPVDPVKDKNTFIGWYKDKGLTTVWNFNTEVVTADATIYAKWEELVEQKEQYVVVFNCNGGSFVRQQKVEEGEKVVKPTDPVKTDSVFRGWFSDVALTKEWNFATNVVTSDITLYAKWDPVVVDIITEHTVRFESNGGSAVSAQTVAEGGKVKRPNDPNRQDYEFVGWYIDKALRTAWDFNRDTVGNDMTLYAKWAPVYVASPDDGPVTATFNVSLSARLEGVSNPAAQTVDYGSRLTAPNVTRSGYQLVGWYAEDGDTPWDFAADRLTVNTTLFARWSSGDSSSDDGYTPSLKKDNTLYIHYLRNNNDDYGDWSAWVWLTGGNGSRYTSVGKDESGTIIEIDLLKLNNPTVINFKIAIISSSGTWGEADGGDNMIKLSDTKKVDNSYHWFVRQGAIANGANKLVTGGTSFVYGETENLRASNSDVDRSYARNLPVAPTATTCDEMGVGYQIFVASFCDSNGDGVGDIRGIINKLDYLDSLNVDVLWLTPIQSSNSIHGYDCYDYYAIDPKFGTNADYRELVYKAHQKGIKVIMDLVVNHTSPQNEWFIKSKAGVIETVTYQDGTTAKVKYRDFYRWQNSGGNRYYSAGDGWYYYSSFNDTMPELNYDCQAVRKAMTDVAMYWMSYGLDGFRMDAIKHLFMWDESYNEGGDVQGAPYEAQSGYSFNLTKDVEFFKEFNYKLKQKYPNCFLLGEQLSGDVTYVAPFYQGMDSLFDFNTFYNFPDMLNSGNAGSAANTFNSNATQYRNNRGDRPINSMISSNHDIPRLSTKFGSDTSKMKLFFAVEMTMPGLSWIYYGDEIGLKEVGRADNSYRQSMKWTSEYANKCTVIGYGNDNSSLRSVADQEKDSGSLLSYVKSLTKLRNDYPVLINGNAVCSEENGMLKITVSKAGEKTITVYHNFTGSSKSVNPGGTRIFGNASIPAYGTAAYRAN